MNRKCIQYYSRFSIHRRDGSVTLKEVSPKNTVVSCLATGSITYLNCPSSNGFSTYSSSSSSSSCERLGCDSVFTSATGRLGSRPILSMPYDERQRDGNQRKLR